MSFGRRKIPKHLILDDYPQKKSYGYGWMLLAIAILLASMLISVNTRASDTLDEEAIYATQAGQLMLLNRHGEYQPSVQVTAKAEVQISGLVAHVSLSQSFVNHTDQWQEGVYVFPLPDNAAVNHMEMVIGERIIIGEIKEKAEAKQLYQRAKSAGKRSALSEQLRPNMFSHRVANIPPQQQIDIRLTYIHQTRFDNGEFSWRMPMTITPRYFPTRSIPEDTEHTQTSALPIQVSSEHGWAHQGSHNLDLWPLPASVTTFEQVPAADSTMEINISLNSGLPLAHIDALFHDVIITKSGANHSVRLAKDRVNMDRDFVLSWRPVESQLPQAAVFSEKIADSFYSLVMLLPPQKKSAQQHLPRDVVFVLDISGSMQGHSIKQAKASLALALQQLTIDDRFNIIAFNTHTNIFTNTLDIASNRNIDNAIAWVQQLNAHGGTEMLPALESALGLFDTSDRLQQTIFITDGAVGNESALFNTITTTLGTSRLFTIGIGSAPNSYFMKKAAEFGRGTFTFINDPQSIATKISELFIKIDNAVAKDITITWPDDSGETYPKAPPDLYRSEPLLIVTKSADLKGDVLIGGITATVPWQQYLSLENHRSNKGIASLWAREKIQFLEDSTIAGSNTSANKQQIIDIALKHKLLSKYTSFVAVENVITRPQAETLKTSPAQNLLPQGVNGKKLTAVAYPAGATNAEITWWFGLFCLTLAIIIRRLGED